MLTWKLMQHVWRLAQESETSGGPQAQDAPVEDEEDEEPVEEQSEDAPTEDEEETVSAPPAKTPKAKGRPASVAQLQRALPKASADELLSYAAVGLTLDQARALHERRRSETATAPGGPGIKPAGQSAQSRNLDGMHPFFLAAEKLSYQTGCDSIAAQRQVASSQPELYSDWKQRCRDRQSKGAVTRVANRRVC